MKITLTTMQALSLAKSIAPAISKDPTRAHLGNIQVTTTGETVTFTATDSYRLHQITVPQKIEPGVTFNVVGVELISALLGAAKNIGKGSETIDILSNDENTLTVWGVSSSMNVLLSNLEFPACDAILKNDLDMELGASYNSDYLAALITAAGHVTVSATKNNYGSMVKIENIHPRKPMHVTSNSVVTGMSFHGVLMPQVAR